MSDSVIDRLAGFSAARRHALQVAVVCNIKHDAAYYEYMSSLGLAVVGESDTTPADTVDMFAEFDEIETVLAIQNALQSAGHSVTILEATPDLPLRLAKNRPDIVFNIAEGLSGRGREAQVPAILNFLGIPFTGSDETTMCITMDKALAKRLLATYGIRTPGYRLVTTDAFESVATPYSATVNPDPASSPHDIDAGLTYPLIIKPNAEGSSKGISNLSVVYDRAELYQALAEELSAYPQDILVEEYIAGREFTVGVLGYGENLHVFTPMEVIFADARYEIYSYEVKRDFRRYIEYACPPDVSGELLAEMMAAARTIYRALPCLDSARIDFRLSVPGQLYFIEVNPLPGLAPGYSDYPMLAGFCGVDYDTLIQAVLNSARERYCI